MHISSFLRHFREDEASTSNIIRKYDNIIKSPKDQRLYRGLILTNKMKVLLISDPSTKKSAASMAVGVGTFHFKTSLKIKCKDTGDTSWFLLQVPYVIPAILQV